MNVQCTCNIHITDIIMQNMKACHLRNIAQSTSGVVSLLYLLNTLIAVMERLLFEMTARAPCNLNLPLTSTLNSCWHLLLSWLSKVTRTNAFLVSWSTIPEIPTSDGQRDWVTRSRAAWRSAFISLLATACVFISVTLQTDISLSSINSITVPFTPSMNCL